jgi:TonB family protein
MGMKKILVIDYDQSSLQTLHKTLTQEGFEVVLASDGQAGWEKFQAEKPDLVLMEAMLSKIHGFELCDRITKDPVRKVPVFIMTGVYKDRVYRTEALRTYGASEYFEKPLDMLKFVASIHALLTVPDIRPEAELKPAAPTKPGNGEPAEGPQVMPVMPQPKEDKRRIEPPPAPKPPKPEAPRVRPSSGHRSGGDLGLGLETVLETKPEREEHIRPEFLPDFGPHAEAPAKPKHSPDAKPLADDDLRLETLLNIKPDKSEHRRAERDEAIDPLRFLSKNLEEKPAEHHRKDHAAEDIDKLLKTTLADFGLETEKKKPAKPVPPPPPPAPVPEKPRAAAPLPQKPKPAPAPFHPPVRPPTPAAPIKEPPAKEPPAVPHAAPAPAVEKPKPGPPPMPAAVAEKPKPQPPSPPPAVAAPKTPPPPKPRPAPQPAPPAPAPAPKAEARVEAKAAVKEPVPAHEPHKPAEARMFKDIYTVEKKKSPAPFIAVAAGLLVVAAVGFFVLRHKHPVKPAEPDLSSAVTQTQSSVPEKTPETTVPSLSEEKLKAVKAKPQVTQKPAEPLPSAAEAIVPPQIVDASRLSAKTPEKKPEAKAGAGTAAAGAVPEAKTEGAKTADTKTAESQGAQTQEPPPAGVEGGAALGAAGSGGETAAPPAAKANPGDLVDLAAVDDQPKILKSVEPVYPAQAKRFGKEGAVTVNALINEVGTVIETGILKGLKDDMGLEKAAADAVRKWKFQPAKKDGVNVKVWKPIVITFRADRSRTP